MEEYHLIQWQLQQSSQSIYIKTQQRDLVKQEWPKTQVVTVEADKVSLSLEQPNDSSMLNQLVGRIVKIQSFHHLALVRIDIDGQELLSLVSQLSQSKLQLSEGQKIFAQFKAV